MTARTGLHLGAELLVDLAGSGKPRCLQDRPRPAVFSKHGPGHSPGAVAPSSLVPAPAAQGRRGPHSSAHEAFRRSLMPPMPPGSIMRASTYESKPNPHCSLLGPTRLPGIGNGVQLLDVDPSTLHLDTSDLARLSNSLGLGLRCCGQQLTS